MNIYYIEYANSVKFFNGDKSIEIVKGRILNLFLRSAYKRKVTFLSLV